MGLIYRPASGTDSQPQVTSGNEEIHISQFEVDHSSSTRSADDGMTRSFNNRSLAFISILGLVHVIITKKRKTVVVWYNGSHRCYATKDTAQATIW